MKKYNEILNESLNVKVGDMLIVNDLEQKKLSDHAIKFLKSKPMFEIFDISDSGKVDIGYVSDRGKRFFFSTNRFRLYNPNEKIDTPHRKYYRKKVGNLDLDVLDWTGDDEKIEDVISRDDWESDNEEESQIHFF